MKKLLSFLLAMAMLVTLAVPVAMAEGETGTETETETTATAPEFPADTTLTVTTSGNNLGLVFPNTAATADGTVAPAHKIEVLATEIKNNSVYSGVHAVNAGAVTADTVYDLRRTISLNAQRGTFTVNVYPMSTTDEATALLGAPLTADFTLTEPDLPLGALRFEFEDYVSEENAKAAESIAYASGGKLYATHNGAGWFKSYNYITRDANADISFDVDLPYDCNYTIDIAMHYTKDTTNLGLITAKVDGNIISKSNDTATKSLALSGTYPWSYMPLHLFRDQGISLSAGKHTVSLEMTLPTNTDNPHHFIADYIQFTPETKVVANDTDSWIEMEDFIGKAITDDGLGTNLTTTNYYPSSLAHGGAAFHTDSYASGDKGYDVLINVPLYVETEGVYAFEFINSTVSAGKMNFYLNETDYTGFYENTLTPVYTTSSATTLASIGLDAKDPITSINTYFNAAHHAAQKTNTYMYLPAGENLLTIEIPCRAANAGGTAAMCIDYLKFTPANTAVSVAGDMETRIELEDYTKNIIYDDVEIDENRYPVLDEDGNINILKTTYYSGASVQYDDFSIGNASGDRLLNMSEKQGITGESVLFIPVTVEKAGWYDVDWVVTNSTNNGHLSVVQLQLDGKKILQNNENVVADGISYLASTYYPTGEFRTKTYLSAGDHTFTMNAAQIATYTNKGFGVKYNADFLALTPIETTESVTLDTEAKTATASVAFDGLFTGKVLTACYANNELVGMSAADITDEGLLTVTAPYTTTPDTLKVFIWSDLENMVPVTVNKAFEVK